MNEPEWLQERRKDRQEAYSIAIASRETEDLRETNLLRDVAFNRHSMNDGEHVSPADNNTMQIGADGIIVKLVQGIDVDAFKRTLSMATRATIGVDLDVALPGEFEVCQEYASWVSSPDNPLHKRRNTMPACHTLHKYRDQGVWLGKVAGVAGEDWEEMLKGGLQTALETQVIVFAVSGVSRTCTHQLVRTRSASFHQQSQRASYYGDHPEVRMPESVWRNPKARRAFMEALDAADEAYRIACDEDISYQDARYILTEGTTNYILCEYSVREFLNVFAYRGCSMFSWEIVHVMREMRRLLIAEYPWLEPYVKISCEKTGPARVPTFVEIPERGKMPVMSGGNSATMEVAHHCTFQGWENVEGQCDFPWAREEARTFKPEFHQIKKKQDS